MTSDKTIVDDNELATLVVERLKTLSPGFLISIGSDGSFTKDQLIQHVEDRDQIGEKIIQVQLNYLRALKTGILLGDD